MERRTVKMAVMRAMLCAGMLLIATSQCSSVNRAGASTRTGCVTAIGTVLTSLMNESVMIFHQVSNSLLYDYIIVNG